MPIVELDKDDFQCDYEANYIWVVCGLVTVIITFIMVATICYKYRDELKIILFEKFNIHIFDKQELHSKKYDAYLLYSDNDYCWPQNTLLPRMEPPYKLFVRNRDLQYGRVCEDIFEEALGKSLNVW